MIRFDNVSHDFGCAAGPALTDISLHVPEGEFVFITGHSGCGKTTLLRLLLRELQPTVGAVKFAGTDLGKLSRRKVAAHRREVGIVFQNYQLLEDLTVWENIALPLQIAKLPKAEIKQRIKELLKLLALEDMEDVFPSQLSGGEAQRVGLARALATAPKVIFADEPTGNLDHANAVAIVNLLKNVNHYGTTVVFATHNLELIPLIPGARHIELENGQIVNDIYCSGGKKKAAASEQEETTSAEAEPKEKKSSPKKKAKVKPASDTATGKEEGSDE